MRISTEIINDEVTKTTMQIKFWEGDTNVHTLTVFVDGSDSYDGSIGIKLAALRQAQEVLAQMQAAILQALKSENDPRAISQA